MNMKYLVNITLKTSLVLLFLVLSAAVVTATETQVVGFDVKDFNVGNMLNWHTTAEVDNKEFLIERSLNGAGGGRESAPLLMLERG